MHRPWLRLVVTSFTVAADATEQNSFVKRAYYLIAYLICWLLTAAAAAVETMQVQARQ